MGSIRRINGVITKEYRAWKAMKARCYSKCNNNSNYQKNKIIVCDRWLNSFENFLKDMGNCPENYSLDRINNSDNYYKENCRWVNQLTQCSNRGEFNKIFTHNGETHTLKEWSKILNIKYTTLWLRIYRSKLSFEESVINDPFNKLVEYKGEKKLLHEWCKILNLPLQTIIDRKFQGWSPEKYFETPIKKVKI